MNKLVYYISCTVFPSFFQFVSTVLVLNVITSEEVFNQKDNGLVLVSFLLKYAFLDFSLMYYIKMAN